MNRPIKKLKAEGNSLEKRLVDFLATNIDGVSQIDLEKQFQTATGLQDTLNLLIDRNQVILFTDSQGVLVFKYTGISTQDSSLTEAEKHVLQLILSSESKGITTKEIKTLLSSQPQLSNQVTKITKSLQKKALIKPVSSVNKTRKVWISFGMEPHPDISGDIWFVEGKLDPLTIDHFSNLILQFLEQTNGGETPTSIYNGLRDQDKNLTVPFKQSHIIQLLQILTFQGFVEVKGDDIRGEEKRYRVNRSFNYNSSHIESICSICQNFEICRPGNSAIHPKMCRYLESELCDIEDLRK